MSSYVKLFGSIRQSSIWGESNETRIVWITLLTMADRNGVVESSIPGLAHEARVTLQECQKALTVFLSPDQFSRTKDHDGRRIEEIDGGWKILNHRKYREKLSSSDRAEYLKDYYVKKVKPKLQNKLSTVETVEKLNSTDSRHSSATATAKRKESDRKERFSFTDIEAEFRKQGSTAEQARAFHNYNQERGWKIDDKPIRSLPNVVRGWLKNDNGRVQIPSNCKGVKTESDREFYRVVQDGDVHEFGSDNPPPDGAHRMAWENWKNRRHEYEVAKA